MRKKKASLLLSVIAALLMQLEHQGGRVSAKTCPLLASGNFQGPPAWQPDGSLDEKTYYRYITDKDFVKLDSIYYCLDAETRTHFQGFIASFKDTKTQELTSLPYGTVNTGSDYCNGFYIKDEIQWIQIKQDDDDIEGVVIGNTITGKSYVFKSQDIPIPDPRDSDLITLSGRLIGFGVTVAQYTRGTTEQIVRISTVFNSCNCIGSSFEVENPPTPMLIVAGVDQQTTQTLAYRNNEIEKWYGQDCGQQTVSLIAQANPNPFVIELAKSGALSPKGVDYPDLIRAGTTTVDMIGRWNFAVRWSQEPGQGVNNGLGQETRMEPLILPFFVQVDPCPLADLVASTADFAVEYVVGDAPLNSESFNFEQKIACGYEEVIQVLNQPGFISWDNLNRQLVIDTADPQHAGSYTLEVQSSVQVPTDYTKTAFTEFSASTLVEIQVKKASNLPAGCDETVFDNLPLQDLTVSVHGPQTTFQLAPTADSVSKTQGNGDGVTYCGERVYQLVNPGLVNSFLTLDPSELLILESFDANEIGQFVVDVEVFFVDEPTLTKTQSFTVTVNPCQVQLYEVQDTIDVVTYTTGSGPMLSDSYMFEMTPVECGYSSTVSVTGLPVFASHDVENRQFAIDSDTAQSEQFNVKVTSTVQFPKDYTLTETSSVSQSFDMVINVVNPCQTATLDTLTLRDMQTRFTESADEQALPAISDSVGGQCGQIAFEIVNSSDYAPVLTLQGDSLVLESFSNQQVGAQNPIVRAYLVDYPQIQTETTFTATLNPCILVDFTVVQPSFTYVVGSGQYQADRYVVETEPAACSYEPQITFSGLPAFSTEQLLLESGDRQVARTYEVEMSLTMQVPADYTYSSFSPIKKSTTFTIIVEDPCEQTVLDDFQIEDVFLSVKGLKVSRDLPLQVPDSVSKQFGNSDGVSFCGERTFTIQQFFFYGGFLTVNENVDQMEFATETPSDSGQYTIEVTVELTETQSVTKSSSFVVTINPCQVQSFEGTVDPTALTYQVASAMTTIFSYNFSQTTPCGYEETIELAGVPSFMSHDAANKQFTVFTSDIIDSGTYTITVTSTIQVPQDYTLSSLNPVTSQVDFTLTVEADCQVSEFLDWSLEGTLYTTSVKEESQKVTLGPVLDSVSQINGNQDGFSFCGQRVFSLVDTYSFLSIVSSGDGILIIEPLSQDDQGLFTVEVMVSLLDHPDVKKVATIQIEVNPCRVTSFEGTIQETSLSYSVNTPATTGGAYTFQQTRECGYVETVTVVGLPSFATHNDVARTFTVETDNALDEDAYIVTVTGSIQVPQDYTRTSFTEMTSSVEFTIVVQEECGETIFDDLVLADMAVFVKGPASTLTIDPVMDSVSKQLGNQDGLSFCGARQYEIVDSAQYVDYLSLTERTLSLASTSDSEIGTYQVQLKVSLVDQPDIEQIVAFQVTVEPCQVSSFAIVGPADSNYKISDPEKSLSVPTSSQGVCSYAVTYDLVDQQPFLTINSATGEVKVNTAERTFEGVYTVGIRGTLSSPNADFTVHSFTLELTYEIDPCTLTEFDDVTVSDMQAFVLGDEAVQIVDEALDSESKVSGDFSGATFCGPRLYSLVDDTAGLVNVESDTRKISLSSASMADVGQLTVTLLVQLQDYPEITKEVQFKVTVNPCQISKFDVTLDQTELVYTLGAPTLASPTYTVTQVNDCKYPVAITVDSTSFITLKEEDREFTIETRSKTNVGIHTVTIEAEIKVPDDYTMTSESALSSSASFTVEVLDPCRETQLEPFTINDLISYSQGEVIRETLPEVPDSVSLALEDGSGVSFCGARTFRLDGATDFLTLEDGDVVFDTSEAELDMSLLVTVIVSLYDYPGVEAQSFELAVQVLTCKIETLTPPADEATTYYIRTPEESVYFDAFVEEPACGYSLEYSFKLEDGSALPSWIVADADNRSVTFQTQDIQNQGEYTILITGSTPAKYSHDPHAETMKILLEVKFDCAQDEILSIAEISNQKILLQESSQPFRITPVFSQILDSCPESLTLQKLFSAGWSSLSVAEASVVQIDSSANHQIVIDRSQRSLDGEVWTLRLTISNYSSSQSISTAFDVSFEDACWSASLTPPALAQLSWTFELYKETMSVGFSPMLIDNASCGPPTYELVYVTGPLRDQSSIVLTDGSFSSELEDRSWIGTHSFKVKGLNGEKDKNSELGNEGVFGTTLSKTITVVIIDPCVNTILQGAASLFPATLSVPQGETQTEVEIMGPTNSVSVTFGNGFDACGPIAYSILNEDRTARATTSKFYLRSTTNMNLGDEITLKVVSAAGNGPVLTENLTIKLSMRDVPRAQPVFLPITISYRECEVLDFVAPIIEDVVMSYRSTDPVIIFFTFDEAPCSFPKTYQAALVSGNSETPLPDFIKLVSEDQSIVIFPPKTFGVLGDYEVKLSSQLGNSLATVSQTTFKVSIVNDESEVVPFYEMPEFSLNLDDLLVVTVGHSLTYPITFTQEGGVAEVDAQPFTLILSMNLAKVRDFASFEPFQNLFRVDGQKLKDSDAGFYTIDVSATFTNGTHAEKMNDRFRLEVRASPKIIDFESDEEVIVPENIIYISEWSGLVESRADSAMFNRDQPVPYVHSLSHSGVLTIRWDREMLAITNTADIPPTEVILRQQARRKRRSLKDDYWMGDYFGSIDGYEKVDIKKAVEVQLERPFQDDKPLEWSILESTPQQFVVQIHFQREDLMGQESLLAHVKVTFWGTEFFKSSQAGEPVRLGTTLLWPIFNQLSQEQATLIDEYREPFTYAFAGAILAMVLLCPLGTLVPTWIFLNTLQLLAHLPLLDIQLPQLTNGVLLEELTLLRLDWLHNKVETPIDFASAGSGSQLISTFDKVRLACGYSDEYARLLTMIFTIACVFALAQILVQAALRAVKCKSRCPALSNLVLRLALLFSIELTLSLVINLLLNTDISIEDRFAYFSSVALVALGAILLTSLTVCALRGDKASQAFRFVGKRSQDEELALKTFVMQDGDLLAFARHRNLQRLPDQKQGSQQYMETQHTQRKLLTTDGNYDTEAIMTSPVADAYVKELGDYDIYGGKEDVITPNTDRIQVDQLDGFSRHTNSARIMNEYNRNLNVPIITMNTDIMRMSKDTFKPSSMMSSVQESGLDCSGLIKFPQTNANTRSVSTLERQVEHNFRSLYRMNNSSGFGNKENMRRATVTTDEFLTDKQSVGALNSLGRLEQELEDELQKSPLKNNKDQILVFQENPRARYLENEREHYEGGEESDYSSRIKLPPQSSPQANQSNLSIDSSIRNPQSIESRRAQTKLNQRGVDLATCELSFAKGHRRKISESLRIDRDMLGTFAGTFTNDSSIDSQVQIIRPEAVTRVKSPVNYSASQSSQSAQKSTSPLDMIVLDPELVARIKSKLVEDVRVSLKFKTLVTGLKLGHPGNVAYVYPLLFILRRLCFVAAIILLVEQPVLSLLVFVALSISVLAYSLSVGQWADPWSNRQHIFNEVSTYLLGTLILLYRVVPTEDMQGHLDLITVALLGILLTGNSLVMLFSGLRAGKLCLVRVYNRTCGRSQRAQMKGVIRSDISKLAHSIQQSSDKQSPINFEDHKNQEDAFVKVVVSRTSWWQRLFHKKEERAEIEVEDSEACRVIASSSGGFHGKFTKFVDSQDDHQIDGLKTDPDYDPLGVFRNQRNDHHLELISREGSFKTNGYSQQDRVGLSDFEFQSQNCGDQLTLRRDFQQRSFNYSTNGGRQTHFDRLEADEDQKPDLGSFNAKLNRSPDARMSKALQKAYMQNDLGPIFQAVNEGTPSECNLHVRRDDFMRSPNKANLQLIEEECKETLNFEQRLMRFEMGENESDRSDPDPELTDQPYPTTQHLQQRSNSQALRLHVQNHSLKDGISVVHEVDEVSGLSKTPGSALNFIQRSSLEIKLPIIESSNATIIEGKNTLRPSTNSDSMEVHSNNKGAMIVIKGEDAESPSVQVQLSPVGGPQQSQSKRLEQEFQELSRLSKSASPAKLTLDQDMSTSNLSVFPASQQKGPKMSLEDAIMMTQLNQSVLLPSRNPEVWKASTLRDTLPASMQKSLNLHRNNTTERYSSPQKKIPDAMQSSDNISLRLNMMPEQNFISLGSKSHREVTYIGHDARFVSPAKSQQANQVNNAVLLRQGSTISIQSGLAQGRLAKAYPLKNNRPGESPISRHSVEAISVRSPTAERRSLMAANREPATGRAFANSVEKTARVTSLESIDGGSKLVRTGAQMLNISNAKHQPRDLFNALQRISGNPVSPRQAQEGGPLQTYNGGTQSSNSSKGGSPSRIMALPVKGGNGGHMQRVVRDMIKTYSPKNYEQNPVFKIATPREAHKELHKS